MNTKQIEIILKLAETLNFTKAAQSLYITQPSLSYQINSIENEIRFKIFERSQNGVSLTPSGKSFIENLRKIDTLYKNAVEEAQNYKEKFNDDIIISLPYRSAIHKLPEAMILMNQLYPKTLITPKFGWENRIHSFLNQDIDIIFDDYDNLKNIKGIKIIHLYQSHIYLVCNKVDPLAKKELITTSDLKNETLMIGGGSQRNLKIVQQQVLDEIHIPFFNSNDHDTTLTNIAAKKAIVLAPGFLHDRNDGFCWIPFDTDKTIDCCLGIKENDTRDSLHDFINILINQYKNMSEDL